MHYNGWLIVVIYHSCSVSKQKSCKIQGQCLILNKISFDSTWKMNYCYWIMSSFQDTQRQLSCFLNCLDKLSFNVTIFIHTLISNFHNNISLWQECFHCNNRHAVCGRAVLACVLIVNLWTSSRNRHSDPGQRDLWPLTITNLIYQSASAHRKLFTLLQTPDITA